VRFSLQVLPEKKQYLFTAVSDVHAARAVVEDFEVKEDTQRALYAVLDLRYE